MNEDALIRIIKKAPVENDHWDFKEKWHEDNGELLRDIINFANTPHHDDCYIILGVNDKNGKIIGVEKDPNRRNKQQLQDYLRRQPFAQNWYPLTNVETFKLSGHYIDVITIKNSNNVPIYLNRRVNRKGKPMQPGLIYSRINDSNTPVDESTSDKQMELLWEKRFHLDVSIYDRYKAILTTPQDWEQIITEDNHECFIYLRDPNFVIKVEGPLENKNSHFESFMMSEFNIRIEWFIIKLFYGNNEIYYNYDIPVDDSSAEIIIPDHHFINVNHVLNGISYHCYIKDELPYILTNFINDVRNVSYAGYWWNYVTTDNVIYETKKEKAYYEKLVFDNYEKVKSSEFASDPETVQSLTSKIKLSGTRGEGGDITLIAKEMEKEHLLVKYIKKLQQDKKDQQDALKATINTELAEVQHSLNTKMASLNEQVCGPSSFQPPRIELKPARYNFETINDQGTGTSFKGLIIFDQACLDLTRLPCFVHDSLLFSNIEIDRRNRIIKMYAQETKQIFISIDSIEVLSEKAQEIIRENTVLTLERGGKELFGRSWNEQATK